MLQQYPGSPIDVNIVANPSLKLHQAHVTLSNGYLLDFHKLATDVASLCYGQPHRIYWRITEFNYLLVSGYIELKAALNMMREPHWACSLYVVADEPRFMFTEFSEDSIDNENDVTRQTKRRVEFSENEEEKNCHNDFNDVSSLLRHREDSSDCVVLTDQEILRCAFDRREVDEHKLNYEFLTAKTSASFTKEKEFLNKQFDLLMKGFPRAKTVDTPLPSETKKISSPGTSSRGGPNKKNDGFKTGNDVRESSGQEPTRSEGRLDEITNTWRDVKRALSLLCVKTFSSNAAMLEAPPGSREDLVEAARTPCTPTDLDTMLYGYTNSIYVLDHTPESLPDMDMLQLFASPAGRALVTGDNRSTTTSTTRGGSTSSTSLSRESSLRGKKSRRASSTVSLPTPPPRQRKSSAELYKEAVEILGLTCSLTDSCRCLDCQSAYFDCDDDYGDARSELAAGTPILLDHALTHPLTCSIQ